MSLISVRCADLVGTITLDHPAKRNALSEAMVHDIVAALAELKAAKTRVAILRAAPGARVWSAGTTSASCRRAAGIRSAGTIRCAT
jgi:methylmalonyl-CoA decarboxylase